MRRRLVSCRCPTWLHTHASIQTMKNSRPARHMAPIPPLQWLVRPLRCLCPTRAVV
ncbi:hypothetical protein CTRI78_v010822 [Colletotrichum trifolii]|uniref:Uncharacterized protein n=1 Tax=Colletotrichum trifolii TaxID=5466 RepID=A0A4R8QHQ6_COLTR|nr:hypothetical protein CTRI78_v010822 [Colletotrichum trifolii]